MLRTVKPHALRDACHAQGITPENLSCLIGISTQDLEAVAAGRLALSAQDRFAILAVLLQESG
jgi:hypothetical protein